MKQETLYKALALKHSNKIIRDEDGTFYVPSSDKKTTYLVSVSGLCNCPATTSICYHVLACFDAHAPVQAFMWATDLAYLRDIAEYHAEEISAMPERLKAFCRQEYLLAKSRITGSNQQAWETRKFREGDCESLVVSRQEAARDYGAIAIC